MVASRFGPAQPRGTVTDGLWRCAGPPGWISMDGWSRKAGRSPTGGTRMRTLARNRRHGRQGGACGAARSFRPGSGATRGSRSGRRRTGSSPCDRASCSPPMRRLARQDGIAPAQSARSTPTSSSVHCPIVDHAMSGDRSRCRRRGANMSAYRLLRDGSTVRPSGAVPLRCHAITLVAPADPLLPDVGRGRPCVVVIERGVEDRDDPAVPTYRPVRSCNDRKSPFNSPLTG